MLCVIYVALYLSLDLTTFQNIYGNLCIFLAQYGFIMPNKIYFEKNKNYLTTIE